MPTTRRKQGKKEAEAEAEAGEKMKRKKKKGNDKADVLFILSRYLVPAAR
jgi:hypothetical protein